RNSGRWGRRTRRSSHRAASYFVSEVRRTPRRQDLGQEPGRGGLDVHVHAAGAPWRNERGYSTKPSSLSMKHRIAPLRPPPRLHAGITQEVALNGSQRAPKARTWETLIY